MKLIAFIFLIFPISLWSQTITNPTSAFVTLHFETEDSVDFDLDGLFDIWIASYFNLDNGGWYALGLNGTALNTVVDSGETFGTVYSCCAGLISSSIGCEWWWNPIGNSRYLGFRKEIEPGKRIYGWLEFFLIEGESGCLDTLKTGLATFSPVLNKKLFAGEMSPITGLIEASHNDLTIYPNPVKDGVTLRGNPRGLSYNLVDISGRMIDHGPITSSGQINFSKVRPGVYLLVIQGPNEILFRSKISKL